MNLSLERRRFDQNHRSSSVNLVTWQFAVMWQTSRNGEKGPVPSVWQQEPELPPLSVQGGVLHPFPYRFLYPPSLTIVFFIKDLDSLWIQHVSRVIQMTIYCWILSRIGVRSPLPRCYWICQECKLTLCPGTLQLKMAACGKTITKMDWNKLYTKNN